MNKNIKQPLIIGNWKLNNNKKTIRELILGILKELTNINICNVVIAPPMVYLDYVNNMIYNSKLVLGAQNVDIHINGAFTGETSVNMLKDIGVKYVIIGHSERRFFHKETNEHIIKKIALIKKLKLIPVLCIGEEINKEKEIINQIDQILKKLGIMAFKDTIIAYEPVCSIGTGKAANPKDVQKIHKLIRNYIANQDVNIAKELIIQYGGSVNDKNAVELFSQPDVDGLLLGKSSLNIKSFINIVKIVTSIKKLL